MWKKLNSLFGKENVFVVGGILSNQEVAGSTSWQAEIQKAHTLIIKRTRKFSLQTNETTETSGFGYRKELERIRDDLQKAKQRLEELDKQTEELEKVISK